MLAERGLVGLVIEGIVVAMGSHSASIAISEADNARWAARCELALGLAYAIARSTDEPQGVFEIRMW